MRIKPLSIILVLIGTATLLLAQDATVPKSHAPMEFLGMGPEMFQDRSVAWIKAFGEVCEQAISKLGIIALAILAVWKNIITNAEIKGRLDRQGERIDKVAISVPSSTPSHVVVDNPPSAPANVTEVQTP